MIASGDGVYKMDYNNVLEYHIDKKADITVVCKEMPQDTDMSRFGVIKADETGRVMDFEEKPMATDAHLVSCGIYIIRRRQLIELIEKCDIPALYCSPSCRRHRRMRSPHMVHGLSLIHI